MPADPPSLPPTPPKAPDPSRSPDREEGQGTVLAERQEQRVEPPKMFQVVMLNDDYTPMEFVVLVLQEYFLRDIDTATQIMLKIHHEGRGICGVYSKDVAATKVELVQAAAKRAGHPLQCIMEAA
jgi:ATP-dependent Clp protease adaptor protein ClpS